MSSVTVNTTGFPLAFSIVFWDNITGEKVREVFASPEDIAEYIAADNDIEEVSLFGLRDYNEGIKQHIEELIATKYTNHKIEIEVM